MHRVIEFLSMVLISGGCFFLVCQIQLQMGDAGGDFTRQRLLALVQGFAGSFFVLGNGVLELAATLAAEFFLGAELSQANPAFVQVRFGFTQLLIQDAQSLFVHNAFSCLVQTSAQCGGDFLQNARAVSFHEV